MNGGMAVGGAVGGAVFDTEDIVPDKLGSCPFLFLCWCTGAATKFFLREYVAC
jgi:hypothetical protein